MKKRIVSMILLLTMAAGLLPLSGCRAKDDGGAVTRGEWIAMLSEGFGMDSYIKDIPYYSDITSQSALFPYVQSAAEWKVLSIFTGETLNADKKVTREEVASTAAIAAGCDVSDEQFDSKGRFNSDTSVQFAVAHNILQDDKNLSGSMTQEECEAALSAARSAYLTAPIEEKIYAAPNPDLVDFTNLDMDVPNSDDNHFIISDRYSGGVVRDNPEELKARIDTGNGIVEVGIGDVFITAPTAEAPGGVAYKVTSIEEVDGEIVFTTEEPTLDDLFEELDIHTTVSVNPSDIIWLVGDNSTVSPQGISAGAADDRKINSLAARAVNPAAMQLGGISYHYGGFSKHFEFGNASFEKNWSNHSSSVIGSGEGAQALSKSNFVYNDTPSIEDFNGSTESWSRELEIDNSFSGGYKITGDISISEITVTTEVEWGFLKLKYLNLQVASDISAKLTLTGNLNERLHIATIPIALPVPGLSVGINLYLYADANGSLVVTASLGSSARVEFENGKLKHSAKSQPDAKADANIEVNFGAEVSASLDAFSLKLVDIGASAGALLTASAHVSGACKASEEDGIAKLTYQESLRIQADLYAPMVKLYAGSSDTVIGKLGVGGSWDIITKENCAMHYSLADYEWVFWEETVLADKDGNILDSESSTAGDEDGIGATDPDRLDLRTYVLTLNGESKRLELDLVEGEAMPAVTWSSENPGVARVDESGMVSPVGTGYTIITVSLQSDPTVCVKCAVYVEEIGEENWEFLPADTAARI